MTNEHLEKTFPMPFSGINRSIRFPTQAHMKIAAMFLVGGCNRNHAHHFAIAPEQNSVYCDQAAVLCIAGTINKDKVLISYYNEMVPRAK